MTMGAPEHHTGLDDAVVAAYGDGLSVADIAARHHLTEGQVYAIIQHAVAQPEAAAFCAACGVSLPAVAAFCPGCGTHLPSTDATILPEPGYPLPGPVTQPERPQPAMWVLLGAGIAGALGAFLPWVTINAPIIGTISKAGTDGQTDGWIVVGLGVAVAALAGVWLTGHLRNVFAAGLAGVASLGMLGVAVADGVQAKAKEAELRAGMSGADDPLGLTGAFTDALHVTLGPGLLLAGAAGLAGAIAVAVTIVRRG